MFLILILTPGKYKLLMKNFLNKFVIIIYYRSNLNRFREKPGHLSTGYRIRENILQLFIVLVGCSTTNPVTFARSLSLHRRVSALLPAPDTFKYIRAHRVVNKVASTHVIVLGRRQCGQPM